MSFTDLCAPAKTMKTNMTMDISKKIVSPMKHSDFPAGHVGFQGILDSRLRASLQHAKDYSSTAGHGLPGCPHVPPGNKGIT